jgi:HlyD family secretion protein
MWLIHWQSAASQVPPRGLLLAGVATVTLLLAGSAGCNQPSAVTSARAAQPTAEQSVPSVTLVKPERKTIRRLISQPGYIQAFEQTPLVSKIAGYVRKVSVDIGDRVSAGQVLAELWVPEMEVDLMQKQALVGQAEAEVKQAQAAAAVAEADFRSAEARVQATEATRLRA